MNDTVGIFLVSDVLFRLYFIPLPGIRGKCDAGWAVLRKCDRFVITRDGDVGVRRRQLEGAYIARVGSDADRGHGVMLPGEGEFESSAGHEAGYVTVFPSGDERGQQADVA